ncbi:MAG: SigB/SigF/SigG family RNA polymerase sigma factor [Lachnospiraceae bacterium]|nr:SigB/SigF/SigG family RNA polymerase sigma factor [Lachnospiraceae bacterium]
MDTIGLIRLSQEGDRQAREQLITENMGLVWSMVRRFMGRGCEAEDLFQIGTIGLIKAIDKFDVSYDVKFSTYAVPMISGEIKRFLRDDGMIKVSRTLKENNMRLRAAEERLSIKLGRDATLEEIAEDTGLSMEDIVLAMEACTEVESLSKPVNRSDGTESTLAERIPGDEDATEQIVNHLVMKQLLDALGEEERYLIELRYFKNKTQTEIAELLGVSQVQVSRMEKKILQRMRTLLA